VKTFLCLTSLGLAYFAGLSTGLSDDFLTNQYSTARTGLAAQETTLTPANVSGLKILFQDSLDGNVYAQPLYVARQVVYKNGVSVGKRNLVFVATEHGSVYAINAETGVIFWQVSLIDTGFTPIPVTDQKAKCAHIAPEESITATPVIDRTAGANGQIFVVAMEKGGKNIYNYKLHALDLATGTDALTPTVISASVSGSGPATTFVAIRQRCRPGLLLLNGTIYLGFGSFCEGQEQYSGWILGYRESDLSQVAVFNTNPNGAPVTGTLPDGSGGGIWQSGLGLATDGTGNIYVAVGNGPFDQTMSGGFPANQDMGDSVLKLSTTSGLSVSDYFTPFNVDIQNAHDTDLGSGGVVVLPDIVDTNGNTHHLMVAGGKDGDIYVLDRDNLGKFNASTNNIYQEIPKAKLVKGKGTGAWSSIAYFNNSIYKTAQNAPVKRYQFDFTNPDKPLLNPTPAAQTSQTFAWPAFTPAISSNGTANGIVWGYELGSTAGVLHAYDATTLTELFNSGSLLPPGVKFLSPTVCNGRVYLGTSNSLVAFGL
jgi:outer membrane protein assembly factor BamB